MSRYYEASDIGAVAHNPIPKPPHMQCNDAHTALAKHSVIPASWGVGTFHQNNPIFEKRTVQHIEVNPGNKVHRGSSSRQVVSHFSSHA